MKLLNLLHENTQTTPLELKQYLEEIAVDIQGRIMNEYDTLENTCDIAADMVVERLSDVEGFNASVINGEYHFKSEDWSEGHRWALVVYGNHMFIVDPTAAQFEDGTDLVINIDDSDADQYVSD